MGQIGNIKISTPTFTTELPSNGKKVTFSPFRVGDEKTLILAQQSEEYIDLLRAIKQIVDNCVEYDINEMEQYDIEYMFVQLRMKSVGETSEIGLACQECQTYNTIKVDLEEIKVQKSKDFKNIIKVSNDLAFKMKQADQEEIVEFNAVDPGDQIKIVARCIKEVYSGEDSIEVELGDYADLENLIESMTTDQFRKFDDFFGSIPRLKKDVEFVCESCGKENKQTLEGLSSFF